MKQRITSEDISYLIPALNNLLDGSYLNQIYDGSSENTKTIILKLKTKLNEETINYYLLIESGIRIHTIDEFNSVRNLPSGMVGKFRRELKDRRLFPIKQIGKDRSIDLQFSNDKHLIIELYDKGNFVLTDDKYKIIYVVRPYEISNYKVELNEIYPIDFLSNGQIEEKCMQKAYYIPKINFSGTLIEGKNVIEVDNMNTAMKLYFKTNIVKKEQKKKKKQKNDQKTNIENQIKKLTNSENKLQETADDFQENIQIIQEVIDLVNKYMLSKIPLFEIESLVKQNYTSFKKIKLTKDNIILDNYTIDFKTSAYNNLSNIYSNKKRISLKKDRAVVASTQVKDTSIQLREKIKVDRKYMKFEDYWWFINNCFLIIVGKSADDNEKILSNVEANDILIHGHFDKSPWGVIKNPDKLEVPIKVINYAGSFLVHRSWNWVEKSTNVPYYTFPDKVSKSAPSGEFMGKGSRMVHEKNFLAKAEMMSGIGIIFKSGFNYYEKLGKDTIIDFAMVTCAPYNAMNQYDYKIKIKPNGQKKDKGRKKLIESIIRTFLKTKNINNKANDYIRAIPYDEWDRICLRFITL